MPTYKLFVSHSSKTKPANLALLKALCKRLDENITNFETVFDQKEGAITAGDDWYRAIDCWMGECNAAVILFSKDALDSDWVKKEAAVLAWRANLQPEFALVPVLLDGITPETLDKNLYGVLKIRATQCISSDGDVDALEAALRTALAKHSTSIEASMNFDPSGASFDPLEGDLQRYAKGLSGGQELERIAEELQLPLPTWPPSKEDRVPLAIARHLLAQPKDALPRLHCVMKDIKPRPPEAHMQNLFCEVRSLWVDGEVARAIPASTTSNRTVGIMGEHVCEFTADRHIERAWPSGRAKTHWKRVTVAATSRSETEVFNDIEDAFAGSRQGLSTARLLGRVNKSPVPVVVILPTGIFEGGDEQCLLTALTSRYPKAIFVVDCGPERPSWIPEGVDVPDQGEGYLDNESHQMDHLDFIVDTYNLNEAT